MKRVYSIIALILVILMVLSLISGLFVSSFNAEASSISSMQSELDEIAKQKEKLEKELNVISEKKEEELQKKNIIDEQINATQSEINVLNKMLSTLDDQLESAEEQLEEAEGLLNEQLQLSKDRIRSAYEQGDASFLEILIGSKSLYDFISKVEIVSQINAKDREVIANVKKNKEIIETKKEEIKENKQKNEEAVSELSKKEASLEKKQAASDKLLDEINSDEQAKKRAVLEAEAAEEQLQSEIRAALQAAASSSGSQSSDVIDTGDFRWPLDSKYRNITSEFGYRVHPTTGVYKLHTGVDIASSGINGSSIYAAKGGTVMKAGYNRGYGNYVLINHGDGYATLYGHASSLCVSAGQVVEKGTVLGYVGSTGYSTGPHLHFEIIKDGDYVDPISYFTGVMTFTYS